MEKYM